MFLHVSICRIAACLFLAALAGCLGCGGNRGLPGQIEIHGAVTFDGQPVPAGMIYFEPDSIAGHNGPQGFAEIVDGRYSTQQSGRGVQPGPHTVRIEEQQPIEGEQARPMLFYEFRTEANLTSDQDEYDFEVPQDAAKRKRRR